MVTGDERERVRRYVASRDRERATLAAELEDEIAPVRGLTFEQRGDWIVSVCRSAWAILRSRSDFADIVARPDPPAPDFLDLWRRLMLRQRAMRERPAS